MRQLKTIVSTIAVALTFSVASASAAPIVLDFEGVGNLASVNDFYNGGTDSFGNGGVNLGVSFAPSAIAAVDSDAGGSGNIANEPSGQTVLLFLSGDAATLNVAAGFTTGFSFFYAAGIDGFVNVYDGLNGTGNLLASIGLLANLGNCNGDPTGVYCRFDAVGVAFDGIARSVDFGGVANFIVFDDITLGSAAPGEVPEPATLALGALGLAGLAAARRRPRKQK